MKMCRTAARVIASFNQTKDLDKQGNNAYLGVAIKRPGTSDMRHGWSRYSLSYGNHHALEALHSNPASDRDNHETMDHRFPPLAGYSKKMDEKDKHPGSSHQVRQTKGPNQILEHCPG